MINVPANIIVERDEDELKKYEGDRPYWVTAYNSLSGLTSMKSNLMHKEEAIQKAKQL